MFSVLLWLNLSKFHQVYVDCYSITDSDKAFFFHVADFIELDI